MDEPSNHEANNVLRVLKGERRKYTVRVHLPDGQLVEFQSDAMPRLDYNIEDRALWLNQAYEQPTMRWVEGAILLVEENPK